MRYRLARGALALAVLASCGITARSDDFRCQVPADCSDGRECVDGWCVSAPGDAAVTGDGAGGAADAIASDAADCPPVCDSCQRGTCRISCEGTGACAGLVVCPPGMPCDVGCAGATACQAGVDCSAASSCAIVCNESAACAGLVTCGTGRCDVVCNGTGSCQGGIDCSASCRCDTDCVGTGACATEPICPFDACVQGIDCTDNGGACHQCQ